MRDGTTVSVAIALPEQAHQQPKPGTAAASATFPVLLDCHPYRKDDLFSFRGAGLYEYFTGRGFATARMDVRGTGRSGGSVPPSEYSEAEISDCVNVIDWLAAQPWCNGAVGMWGISWSAINTLLVAARRPAALRACIAIHPSDELFASDIHYIDGLLHYDLYELSIDLLNGMTPGPHFPVTEELLADRFDQPPWMASVLAHQSNDGYWRSRSLAPFYDRIACPVFLVGGWYDGYHECVFRLLDNLGVHVQACVGPWTHVLPNMGGPGAPVDWLAQAADWWDRWLRDDAGPGRTPSDGGPPSGREPPAQPSRHVQLFARDWHAPAAEDTHVTGAWRTTSQWPVPGLAEASLILKDGQLVSGEDLADQPDAAGGSAPDPHPLLIDSPPWIGSEVGHWWGDLAADQAPLDTDCAVFDSGPLPADIEILGRPALHMRVEPAPGSHLFARLEDVAADGRVTLVTGAGTAVPGHGTEPLDLELALHWTSWSFPAGHRIRISLSTALWPMFWPAIRTGPVRVWLGGPNPSHLMLPVPPRLWGTGEAPPAAPGADSLDSAWSRDTQPTWDLARDSEAARFTWATHGTVDLGFAAMTSSQQLVFTITGHPKVTASASGEASMDVQSEGRTLTWRIQTSLESSGDRYHYQFRRQLSRDGAMIRERCWDYGLPRRLP